MTTFGYTPLMRIMNQYSAVFFLIFTSGLLATAVFWRKMSARLFDSEGQGAWRTTGAMNPDEAQQKVTRLP